MSAALVCIAGFASGGGHADDDADTQRLLVTGTRSGSNWHDNAASLGWVDSTDLTELRPRSMGEVLNTIPGVFWVDLGNEQHAMSIRQPLSYSAVYLYMEDGIPIRPLGLFNHNALNEVNLAGAGQIEVLKGPASSLYGSNAVGGAINFLTATAENNNLMVGLRADDQGYLREDVQGSVAWQQGGASLRHYASDRDGGWQEHADGQKSSTSFRVDQQLTERTKLWFTGTYSDLYSEMPGALNQQDYDQSPGKSYNSFTWRSDVASRATAFLQHDFSSTDSMRAALFWRDNSHAQLPSYLIFNSPINPAAASGRQNDNRFASLGTDIYWLHAFTDGWLTDLVAGVYADRSPNEYEEWNLAIVRDPANGRYLSYTVTTQRRDYQVDIDNDAFYAQLRGRFGQDWLWTLGAREDQIHYAFDNHLTPSSSTGPADEQREFSHLSPRAGLVYQFTAKQSLFLQYSQGFVPPEVGSQYASLSVPNLREAVFNNYELGWRGQFDRLRTDFTIYQLDGKDEIVSYSIAPGLSEPRNAGATHHAGIEAGIEYQIAAPWSVQFAGAWSEHEYDQYAVSAAIDYSGKVIKQAPEQLLQMSLNWRPLDDLLLRLAAVHVSEYWMDDANTVRYGGHDLLQLYGHWQIGALECFGGVQNLTDEHYADTASYAGGSASYSPGAPRTIHGGIAWSW